MKHEPILSVQNVSYEIDRHLPLDGISLEIPRGSFVGIIGPNGSGKSTLLKTIYHSNKASGGAVYLNGRDMNHMTNRQIARQIAVVAQENQVSFDFSVMEIMRIGLYAKRGILEHTSVDDTWICEEALNSVGMLPFKDSSFLSLSGGEKQKVLIASAFSRDPELIILDEPTNHLDVDYQFQILDIMKSHKDVTIFTSLHDMNMAMQYCDCIAIKQGRIFCTGRPEEVLTVEHLKELFHVKAELLPQPGTVPYIRYTGAYTEEHSHTHTHEHSHGTYSHTHPHVHTHSHGISGHALETDGAVHSHEHN